jgi:hypothetical protein
MKGLATVVEVLGNLFLIGTMVWFAFIATIRLRQHGERLRVLELKTGWLRAQEGPGKRVTVEGQLDALCLRVQKDEDPPYAS